MGWYRLIIRPLASIWWWLTGKMHQEEISLTMVKYFDVLVVTLDDVSEFLIFFN